MFLLRGKSKPKKEKSASGKSGKGGGKKTIVIVALLLVAVAGAFLFKVIDLPFGSSYEDGRVDPEKYFRENGTLKDTVDVQQFDDVFTEKDAYAFFSERGFTQNPIVTEYSIEGECYLEKEISTDSDEKHPIYETMYISANGDVWNIMLIGATLVANPMYIDEETNQPASFVVTETDTVMSYDCTANKFYETVPDESVLKMKKIDKIDAQTLETLSIKEINVL